MDYEPMGSATTTAGVRAVRQAFLRSEQGNYRGAACGCNSRHSPAAMVAEAMQPYKNQSTISPGAARRFAAALCLAVMTLSATAFGQSRETLGEGDSVRITVFQNPDLTTETRISERGTITFPLIGE